MPIESAVASGKEIAWHGRILPNGRAGFSPEKVSKRPPVNAFDLSGVTDRERAENDDFIQQFGESEFLRIKKSVSDPGSSNVSKSPTQSRRAVRGSKGLTSHGRAVVYNCIDYLEWRFGARNLTFATVTLPSVTNEQADAITGEWSAIIKTFVKNLGRKLNVQSLPNWIVGAYENQPRRSSRCGTAFLHFHFIFVGRKRGKSWAVTHGQIRQAWRSAIISRLPCLSDLDFTATENAVGVKQSAASYISKYLSKGSGVVGDVANDAAIRNPSSWFSASLSLRRIVARCVRSGRYIGAFLRSLRRECWLYLRAVRLDSAGEDGVIVGWFGQLKPGWSQLLDIPMYIPVEESNPFVFQFPLPKRFHDGYFPIVLNVGYAHLFNLVSPRISKTAES